MVHDLKYYNHFDKNIINPKIFFDLKFRKNKYFVMEWVDYITYFNKFVNVLEFYIIKSLIKNYYSSKNYLSSRVLITKIIENLNLYIYDIVHYEYFITFDLTIQRFNKLKEIVVSIRNDFDDDKKRKFIQFLISSLDLLEEIIIIFEDNNIFYKNESLHISYYDNLIRNDLEFIPFAGGNINNNKISSFWASKTCITNYQYLKFIEDGGYYKKKYWSTDGYYWLKYNNYHYPKNWLKMDSQWYVDNISIDLCSNFPISHISYFEAEACANYYGGKLPTEIEWNWISSNRNKTIYPNGLELPILFELNTEFSNKESVNNSRFESLMGLTELYGSVWEFTSTIKKSDDDIIEVCLKGGDWKVPNFILNNNLQMFISKDSRDYCTGFRIVK